MMEENEKTAPREQGAEARKCSRKVQAVELIVVEGTLGKGTEEDPMRVIVEVWLPSGELLAVNDPLTSSVPIPSHILS